MGRWAEVYFTNPPEKRDQAVLDLLRELEAGRAGRDTEPAAPTSRDSAPLHADSASTKMSVESLPPPRPPAMQAASQELTIRCEACGHDNPAGHRFCGLCGTKLLEDGVRTPAGEETLAPAAFAEDRAIEQEPSPSRSEPSYHYVPSNAYGLSLFQNPGDAGYEQHSEDLSEDYHSEWDDDSASSPPYRIYLGIALAVVIAVLGYVAWHGSQTSPSSNGPLPPPPAATKQNEPAAAAPKAADEQPQPQAPAPESQPAASNPTASNKEADQTAAAPTKTQPAQPETKPTANEKASRTTAPAANAEVRTPTTLANASGGNGSEELAVAERYLNGAGGQRRDSAEAVKWLWKSIAKQNGEATVRLADLYMRGDGVSKNCDQARVLLDSAASKGVSGAGERLRNLQAFGCQ